MSRRGFRIDNNPNLHQLKAVVGGADKSIFRERQQLFGGERPYDWIEAKEVVAAAKERRLLKLYKEHTEGKETPFALDYAGILNLSKKLGLPMMVCIVGLLINVGKAEGLNIVEIKKNIPHRRAVDYQSEEILNAFGYAKEKGEEVDLERVAEQIRDKVNNSDSEPGKSLLEALNLDSGTTINPNETGDNVYAVNSGFSFNVSKSCIDAAPIAIKINREAVEGRFAVDLGKRTYSVDDLPEEILDKFIEDTIFNDVYDYTNWAKEIKIQVRKYLIRKKLIKVDFKNRLIFKFNDSLIQEMVSQYNEARWAYEENISLPDISSGDYNASDRLLMGQVNAEVVGEDLVIDNLRFLWDLDNGAFRRLANILSHNILKAWERESNSFINIEGAIARELRKIVEELDREQLIAGYKGGVRITIEGFLTKLRRALTDIDKERINKGQRFTDGLMKSGGLGSFSDKEKVEFANAVNKDEFKHIVFTHLEELSKTSEGVKSILGIINRLPEPETFFDVIRYKGDRISEEWMQQVFIRIVSIYNFNNVGSKFEIDRVKRMKDFVDNGYGKFTDDNARSLIEKLLDKCPYIIANWVLTIGGLDNLYSPGDLETIENLVISRLPIVILDQIASDIEPDKPALRQRIIKNKLSRPNKEKILGKLLNKSTGGVWTLQNRIKGLNQDPELDKLEEVYYQNDYIPNEVINTPDGKKKINDMMTKEERILLVTENLATRDWAVTEENIIKATKEMIGEVEQTIDQMTVKDKDILVLAGEDKRDFPDKNVYTMFPLYKLEVLKKSAKSITLMRYTGEILRYQRNEKGKMILVRKEEGISQFVKRAVLEMGTHDVILTDAHGDPDGVHFADGQIMKAEDYSEGLVKWQDLHQGVEDESKSVVMFHENCKGGALVHKILDENHKNGFNRSLYSISTYYNQLSWGGDMAIQKFIEGDTDIWKMLWLNKYLGAEDQDGYKLMRTKVSHDKEGKVTHMSELNTFPEDDKEEMMNA